MSDFTEEQIAALRAPLARENVKERTQAGRTLSYIEGWVAIAEANRIFGFDGWDRETVECRCVSERERAVGQNPPRPGWGVAYIARVRVKVRAARDADGFGAEIVREGTGYGSGIDVDLGSAHESAIKEAETDAMKRALMTFGNPFGLALYDKRQAEVAPAERQAPRAGMVRAADVPPQKANGNGAVLPVSAEEPPEMRLKRAAVQLATSIAKAPTDHVLDVLMDDARDNLAAMEKIQEPIFKFSDGVVNGIEAAKRLRARSNAKIAELRSGK